MNNFFYGEIQSNDITIDKNELSLRLLSKRGEYPKNIDKLESIPGFKTRLTENQVLKQVKDTIHMERLLLICWDMLVK